MTIINYQFIIIMDPKCTLTFKLNPIILCTRLHLETTLHCMHDCLILVYGIVPVLQCLSSVDGTTSQLWKMTFNNLYAIYKPVCTLLQYSCIPLETVAKMLIIKQMLPPKLLMQHLTYLKHYIIICKEASKLNENNIFSQNSKIVFT